MKKYICKKNFYLEDVMFAKMGDYVTLQSDNLTVVNEANHKTATTPWIVDNTEYFASFNENVSITEDDNVNHPSHYTQHPSGIECIEITRHYCFSIGNAIKYLWRAGLKKDASLSDKQKEIEDLNKAIWYIKDRIKQLEHEQKRV
jgi:hypothetical protein